MSTEGGDADRAAIALEAALHMVLADFPDEDRAEAPEPGDYRWLRLGITLGLERPEQARRLRELIPVLEADRAAPLEGVAATVAASAATDTGIAGSHSPVPVRSMLLARAAAVPAAERGSQAPEETFGWAAGLTRDEVLSLGRVVEDMVAAGSPPNIRKGFGLTWDAGVRLTHDELNGMFREFAALQLTVGGVLVGRDLRAGVPAGRPGGLGALFGQLLPHIRPEAPLVTAAFEESGELALRGLVATWNAWAAMCCRKVIPGPTFELLVHPWVTVVGPLPER